MINSLEIEHGRGHLVAIENVQLHFHLKKTTFDTAGLTPKYAKIIPNYLLVFNYLLKALQENKN